MAGRGRTRSDRIAVRCPCISFLLFLCTCAAFAQELPAPDELELEEEHIRSRNEHCDSHASGMRAELGPVTLGNPTEAHTLIRVGISYLFTATGAFSEFATRHQTVRANRSSPSTCRARNGGAEGAGRRGSRYAIANIGRFRATFRYDTPTLRQSFYAPNARGTLYVRRADVRKLRVHVNELHDIAIDLTDGDAVVDLTPYLVPGVNTVQYNPSAMARRL